MATITKKQLVDRIAKRTKLKRGDVQMVVQELLDNITDELAKENRLEFRDFGVFEVTVRSERMAQNPRTLDPVRVPARRAVRFKPGKRMKQGLGDTVDPSSNGHHPGVEVKPIAATTRQRASV